VSAKSRGKANRNPAPRASRTIQYRLLYRMYVAHFDGLKSFPSRLIISSYSVSLVAPSRHTFIIFFLPGLGFSPTLSLNIEYNCACANLCQVFHSVAPLSIRSTSMYCLAISSSIGTFSTSVVVDDGFRQYWTLSHRSKVNFLDCSLFNKFIRHWIFVFLTSPSVTNSQYFAIVSSNRGPLVLHSAYRQTSHQVEAP